MGVALTETDLPHPARRGKVRDIYDLGDTLLLIATDRLSAFDVVLPTGIPERGVVLNELSRFWFQRLAGIVPHHFLAMGVDAPRVAPYVADLPMEVARRAMLVKKAEPVLVECIVRGYLAGSGWAEYRKHGTIGGRAAPDGLQESQQLETPLFTPTTKAAEGHDELITMEQTEELIGRDLARRLERLSQELYAAGHEYALGRGIIIADTKFEFGLLDGEVLLIDEALTPDSSRFWDAKTYGPGRAQDPLDKQFVRDYLETTGWNKEPPGPELPPEIVQQTARRYRDVYQRLTGAPLP